MKVIFGVICLLMSRAVLADWVSVNVISIKAFTEQASHYVAVSNFSNPDGCANGDTVVINRDDTNNWKMVHSMVLSGLIAGRDISVRTAGCSNDGMAIVDGAMLK